MTAHWMHQLTCSLSENKPLSKIKNTFGVNRLYKVGFSEFIQILLYFIQRLSAKMRHLHTCVCVCARESKKEREGGERKTASDVFWN